MDLNDYWQENKGFVGAVAGGGLAFLLGWFAIDALWGSEIRAKESQVARQERELAEPAHTPQQLADARAENERLREAVARLEQAVAFVPRPEFRLDPARGSPSTQYLGVLAGVREDLRQRANRANLELDSLLGMPALSPTREEEIERYLEALDLIETVVDRALAARIDRIERIQIQLDPKLYSREGLAAIERTRVTFTITGSALGVERLLVATQRPQGGRVLQVGTAEIVPSRTQQGEVRLELGLSVVRLTAPTAADEAGSAGTGEEGA
jgi:hypothetical protein